MSKRKIYQIPDMNLYGVEIKVRDWVQPDEVIMAEHGTHVELDENFRVKKLVGRAFKYKIPTSQNSDSKAKRG